MKYFLIGINLLFLFALLVRAIIKGFFANTFNIEILVSGLLLIGLFLAVYLSKKYIAKNEIKDLIEKTQVTLTICSVTLLIFISIGVNLNYLISLNDEGKKEVPIMEIQPFYKTMGGIIKGEIAKPSGYYLIILYHGKKERLKFDEIQNYQDYVGQNIGLHIRKGLLGFEVCIPTNLKNANNL